jgi:ureidoacrylate peracid hydrolase
MKNEKMSRLKPIKPIVDKIDPRTTALIVVDAQNDFAHPEGKYAKLGLAKYSKPVIDKLKKVIETCRKAGIPIIYTVLQFREDYSDAGLMHRAIALGALKIGSWGAQIIDELKPEPNDIIIEKKRHSGFYNTNLEDVLKNLNIKTLIFTGFGTNVCVESTVRDAMYREFNCIVVSDCCASYTKRMHEFGLANIKLFFGTVIDSKELIRLIESAKRAEELTLKGDG